MFHHEADSRKPRRATAGAALALLLALGGGIALGFLEPPGQAQRLPDGSILELRGTTYGPNSTFFDGNGWQRALYRMGQSGPEIGGFLGGTSSPGELNLWFRYRVLPQASLPTPAWIDEHGCRILATDDALGGGLNPSSDMRELRVRHGGDWMTVERRLVVPHTLPRRQSSATFALLGETRAEPQASFAVPIPRGGPFPTWAAGPCPVASPVGDTTFILTRLEHPKLGPFDTSVATFDYQGESRYSRNWRPFSITVSDPTGNQTTALCQNAQDDRHHTIFESLCTRERAWKLKVQFVRDRPADVPPDMVWTLLDVPAPRKDQAVERSDRFSRDHIGIQLRMLHGGGSYVWSGGSGSSISPGLELEVDSPVGLRLQILRLTDQRGRNLTQTDSRWFSNENLGATLDGGRWLPTLMYEYPARSTRLNLTFGIWKMRTAEFLVRP